MGEAGWGGAGAGQGLRATPPLPLQLIPQVSSLSWFTTIVPLVLVLAITAVKDATDDYVSHFRSPLPAPLPHPHAQLALLCPQRCHPPPGP